jgi:hypothetical protein
VHELSAFVGSQRTCKRQLALFNARRRARYAVARASAAAPTGGEPEAADASIEQPDAASAGTQQRQASKKRRPARAPTRTEPRTRTRKAVPATTESRAGSGGVWEDDDNKQFEETLARAFGDGSCCTERNDGMARADPCAAAVSTAAVDAEQALAPFWGGSVVPHAMAPADATLLCWSQLCAPARAEPA